LLEFQNREVSIILTRKRIEIAILAVLAVVLGFYVHDRMGMRMGGVPSPIQSTLATEEDWMLDAILRDISVTASYARGGAIEDVELEIARVPTGALTLPSVAVTVRLGDDTEALKRAIPLEDSFWNPSNYAGLAAELLGAGGSNGPGNGPSEAPGALLDPRPSVLSRESDRISALLASDARDASAHEEAALLLGVFGLREAAYGFDDTRFLLLRITAHLSIARGLRGGASTVTGQIAEAALLALAGRQAQLLEALDRLPPDSDTVQSWRSALYMFSTDDWRAPAPSESLLVQLMRFRAFAAALGVSNAIDRMEDAARSELADWGRILTRSTSRDVSARGFIETQLGREFREIQEVAGHHRKSIGDPRQLAAALNELPGGLVGPDGPRVLSWGLWAAFFQRHLSAALVARDEHLRGALGLPDEAESFGREAERAFSGLLLNPIVQVHRTRYVGARVEDTIGMDDAISLSQRHPELVNPTQWGYLEETALYMMRKRGMPSARSWLSASVLATSLIDSASSRFEILKGTIDVGALRDRIAEVGPRHISSIHHAQGRLGDEKMSARARIEVFATWIERRDPLRITRIVAGGTMPPTFLRTPRPPYLLYYYFAGSLGGALLLTLVMVILGFLFSAVASIRGRLAGITPSYPLGLAIYPVLGRSLLRHRASRRVRPR